MPTKAAMPTIPQPLAKTAAPATPTTVTGGFNFTQPDRQTQKLCTPSTKLFSFTFPPHSDWSDVQADWDGERQKERE